MFNRIGDFLTDSLSGATSLLADAASRPGLLIAGIVALVCAAAVVRGRSEAGKLVVQVAAVVLLAWGGWWGLQQLARRDLAAERSALDARALELATRALMPGSALACLDAMAGETVEDSCEKAVFATPEATAAAVSYVAAQLSLLAAADDHARRAGSSAAVGNVRRALEADRFGIVAHVLATRDGCTPDRCSAFFLLQDASRISVNLAERPFESRVRSYMADWQSTAGRPVASNNPPGGPATPATAARTPNNLYFPSSASIPPVNIMTAEPTAQRSAPASATDPATARKPASAQARPPAGSSTTAPARSAPMQLAPPPQ